MYNELAYNFNFLFCPTFISIDNWNFCGVSYFFYEYHDYNKSNVNISREYNTCSNKYQCDIIVLGILIVKF